MYTNARLREGSWSDLLSYFAEHDAVRGWHLPFVQGNYHPLTMLSLGLDLRLSPSPPATKPADRETDLDASRFHATNVLLHLANTALVFLFVCRLLRALPEERLRGLPGRPVPERAAAVAALLFGVATLHVESVAWVSERKDVLYTFFFLAALLAYLHYLRRERPGPYAAVVAAFVAALLSKGQAVTLAPTLVALDLLLGRRTSRRRVAAEKIPFFALAIVFGLVAVAGQMADGNVLGRMARSPATMRPLFAAYALVQYAVKLFVPVHLLAFYPYAEPAAHPWLLYLVYGPAAIAAGLALAYAVRRAPLVAFAGSFFLINLSTVLQLLPVGGAVMADRYSYVPSIGLFLLVGALLSAAESALPSRARILRAAVAAYAVVIGALTASRVAVWRNSLTLWSDELTRNPESAIAYNNIATYRFHTGDLATALALVDRAVTLDPDWSKAYVNRGMMRDLSGQSALARADYDRTLELRPDQPLALNNRGLLKQEAGDLAGALADFTKAVDLSPRTAKFRTNRAKVYAALGRTAEAIEDDTRAIESEPSADLYGDRALLLVGRGDTRAALADFDEVVRRIPESPYPYLNRAKARVGSGDCAGARADFESAAARGAAPPELRAELEARCAAR